METDKHLHSAVEKGFSRSAELYDRARSGYPPRVVERLFKHLGVQDQSRVLELAAGTGKFTGHLAGKTPNLVVVEPMHEMRTVLQNRFPSVPVLDAIAEAIPLPSGSVDFVFAATAYHWFDPEETYSELLRILRPGGGVGLIWTSWALEKIPDWYSDLRKLVAPFEGDAPRYKHMIWRKPFDNRNEFKMLQFERFDISRVMTIPEICDRFLSISYVSALPDLVFNALKREMQEILKDYTLKGEIFKMPEEIHIYWTFKNNSI